MAYFEKESKTFGIYLLLIGIIAPLILVFSIAGITNHFNPPRPQVVIAHSNPPVTDYDSNDSDEPDGIGVGGWIFIVIVTVLSIVYECAKICNENEYYRAHPERRPVQVVGGGPGIITIALGMCLGHWIGGQIWRK